MIGKLRGIVDSVEEDTVLLDVHGVGYEVFCPPRILARLSPGAAAELVIETHVREDHIHLFGFLHPDERAWFRILTGVQRVGVKVALAILDALHPEQIAQAIAARDTAAFSRIGGIGPKLAERIVIDLKDKALSAGCRVPSTKQTGRTDNTQHSAPGTRHSALEDTISALTRLGYSRSEAYGAALRVSREMENASLDQLIKSSLKELAG